MVQYFWKMASWGTYWVNRSDQLQTIFKWAKGRQFVIEKLSLLCREKPYSEDSKEKVSCRKGGLTCG